MEERKPLEIFSIHLLKHNIINNTEINLEKKKISNFSGKCQFVATKRKSNLIEFN